MRTFLRARRHRGRWLAGAAAALVLVVALPALAAYTGTYTPTQSIGTRSLLTPSSFNCTANGLSNTATLSWTDADATTADPYVASTFVTTGYQIDRKVGNGAWLTAFLPTRTATSASDNSFGGLSIGTQISYRMRSIRSNNWVSADTATVTATVSSFVLVNLVSC